MEVDISSSMVTPYEGFRFHIHPRKPSFFHSGVVRWRPERDVFKDQPPLCLNSTFIRRFKNGEEVYQCNGHDLSGLRRAASRVLPECLKHRPFEGLRLVECFSGDPARGGSSFSDGWEDCGGLAIRYDLLLDPRHDFMTSEKDDFLERRV